MVKNIEKRLQRLPDGFFDLLACRSSLLQKCGGHLNFLG